VVFQNLEQSPTDYLLYYKRATAYFSMQRHTYALEDFEKVLSLTSNTFDNAYLMKARIHIRDGHFALAKLSLTRYIKSKGQDNDAEEVERDIKEGEKVRDKALKERNAELWNACVDSASQALRIASHNVEIRTWRAECSLAAGDVESTVGDLT
jgi:DnaJ family protein C protein 3